MRCRYFVENSQPYCQLAYPTTNTHLIPLQLVHSVTLWPVDFTILALLVVTLLCPALQLPVAYPCDRVGCFSLSAANVPAEVATTPSISTVAEIAVHGTLCSKVDGLAYDVVASRHRLGPSQVRWRVGVLAFLLEMYIMGLDLKVAVVRVLELAVVATRTVASGLPLLTETDSRLAYWSFLSGCSALPPGLGLLALVVIAFAVPVVSPVPCVASITLLLCSIVIRSWAVNGGSSGGMDEVPVVNGVPSHYLLSLDGSISPAVPVVYLLCLVYHSICHLGLKSTGRYQQQHGASKWRLPANF